jgi:superfamily II DNA or RNA helicase
MKLWPHQERGLVQTREAYGRGSRRITFVAPPGAGKSIVMKTIAEGLVANNKRVNIYLHRRMLTRQTIGYYENIGFPFGVVASEFEAFHNPSAPIQICSMQTVAARQDKWNFTFPDCDFFFVDEKHQQLGEMAESVFQRHMNSGACEIAFTATPTGLGPKTCDELVTAAQYSDLLGCNAHMEVDHYCPDMPSFDRLEYEVSERDSEDKNCPEVIVGSVIKHWRRLNPDSLPTILFAPSVKASQWYCEQFAKQGITACHIDAMKSSFTQYCPKRDKLIVNSFKTTPETRAEVIEGSRTGKYKVVCNRFILREAIDMPWLYHGICATTFGSVSSYLQASGRVLRFHKGLDKVIWQDHGGNLYRHGLINQDREWEIGTTDRSMLRDRKKAGEEAESQEDVEGIVCPRCQYHRMAGAECPKCGVASKRGTRVVRELDGTLKKVSGRFFKRKRQPTARQEFVASLYVHKAMAKKNRGSRYKTVEDVIRHAKNRCRKKDIQVDDRELFGIAMSMAKNKFDLKSGFRPTFFPEELS